MTRPTGRRDGARDLAAELDTLREAVTAGRDHLPEDLVARAETLLTRAGERSAIAPGSTVAAMFGSTGSGKSSLVNTLAGRAVTRVAPTRPTTSAPHAVTFSAGPDGPAATSALLDWLGVAARTPVDGGPARPGAGPGAGRGARPARAGRPEVAQEAAGLVLLDLPDIDSTQAAHRELATHLAERVDVLVWVLDPQKYADAVVHREFLAPMASHADVTLVVLNHADAVPAGARDAVVADLRRILAEDGLPDVPVLLTSARTGEGIARLADALVAHAAARVAVHARLRADVRAMAASLSAAAGLGTGQEPDRVPVVPVEKAAAAAAGVPVVTDAAGAAYRQDAGRHVGWPPVRWLARFRPDPMRRLRLGERGEPGRATSIPPPGPAQVAGISTAVRRYVEVRSSHLPERWRADVAADAAGRVPALLSRLDGAISTTDLAQDRRPAWWRVVGALQWLLLAAAVAGAAWLGLLAVLGYLQMPAPDTPRLWGWPVPTLLLLGGVGLGLLLALFGSRLARAGAARRSRAVGRRLGAAVREQVAEHVTDPLTAQLEDFDRFATAVRSLT